MTLFLHILMGHHCAPFYCHVSILPLQQCRALGTAINVHAYLAELKNRHIITEFMHDFANFPDDEYWIGLRRADNDEPWIWSHSHTMLNDQESDWISTRKPPDHLHLFCAVAWVHPIGIRGGWLHSSCMSSFRAICEYRL